LSYRRYALERVGAALVLFWLAVTGVYLMLHLGLDPPSPSDGRTENRDYVRPTSRTWTSSTVSSASNRSDGLSPRSNPSVTWFSTLRRRRFPWFCSGLFFGSLVAVPLGIVWGVRRPGRLTRPMRALSAVLFGLSGFLIALLLIYWVGYKWGLLPLGGYCDLVGPTTDCGGFTDWARALILPGISLGIFFAAVYLRLVSALVRNARQARKRGDEAARRHAGLSYLKLLGGDFGWALGVALLVEAVFGIPGLGHRLLLAGDDAPVIEGVLIFATFLAMGVNLVADLAVAAADPSFRRF
jgi:peptide/nickel transport system permease protein